MLADYGIGIASFFVVPPLIALCIWLGAAVITGLLYAGYDYWMGVRHPEPDNPPRFDFRHLMFSPLAWPLMFMEVVENTYAEFHPTSDPPPASGDAP